MQLARTVLDEEWTMFINSLPCETSTSFINGTSSCPNQRSTKCPTCKLCRYDTVRDERASIFYMGQLTVQNHSLPQLLIVYICGIRISSTDRLLMHYYSHSLPLRYKIAYRKLQFFMTHEARSSLVVCKVHYNQGQ